MTNIYSKEVLDSIRNCILSLFWAKREVISFLKSVGCTKEDLKNVEHHEQLKLSRKTIIDDTFNRLKIRTDGGLSQFRVMIKELTEWTTFDSYSFGPAGSLNINEAKANIKHLKGLQISKDAKFKEEKLKREAKEEKLKDAQTLANLHKRFINLIKGSDEKGKIINLQKRGYLFEELLRDLFIFESLTTTEAFQFNIPGEQIDGALKYDGEHYIIEAKWQEALVASDSLYKFAYKVDGKMYGRGIFISINGYSEDSVKALKLGKSLKTILIDGADLALVMEGIWTFTYLLDRKIKAAQTMGFIYVDVDKLREKISY